MVEVPLEHDAIVDAEAAKRRPRKVNDLGHSCGTNFVRAACPRRMARGRDFHPSEDPSMA